jgi:outer membrane protein TolC
MLARYNNYDSFYKKYERNNYTIGVNIRFPFINPSQRAVAQAADADAIKAKRTAEGVRNDVQAETLKIQRGLRQLAAARDVAKLEYDVAQGNIDAIHAKIESGEGIARDEEQARLDANAKYAAYLDSNYELIRGQMQMMRMMGNIQDWAFSK